jgi:hypothetical protein
MITLDASFGSLGSPAVLSSTNLSSSDIPASSASCSPCEISSVLSLITLSIGFSTQPENSVKAVTTIKIAAAQANVRFRVFGSNVISL